MTTNIGSLNSYISQNAGKMYVPVNKSALLYSHFDHVSGFAAKTGQNGISISKIRILNSLIERMSAIKNESSKEFSAISDEQADVLIKNYQRQIRSAMQTPYLLSGASSQTGVLFSFEA